MLLQLGPRRAEAAVLLGYRHRHRYRRRQSCLEFLICSQLGADEQLCRLDAHDLIHRRRKRRLNGGCPRFGERGLIRCARRLVAHLINLRDQEIPGRDIHCRHPVGAAIACHRHQEVVSAAPDDIVLEQRPRRDHPRHFAPNETLGLLRVLDLLAYRGSLPLLNQHPQVAPDGMMGNAAHRNTPAVGHATTCQREFKQARADLRILPEHLIEVTHAEENQHIGVVAFGLRPLPVHRCEFRVIQHAKKPAMCLSLKRLLPWSAAPLLSYCRRARYAAILPHVSPSAPAYRSCHSGPMGHIPSRGAFSPRSVTRSATS